MNKHISVTVRGKVQGVFFRASTKEKADELGITGFVRNELDGSVYIEAEGNAEALNRFLAWCHYGPSRANVQEVITAEDAVKQFSTFEVRR